MRKVIVFENVSLDGFFTDQNNDMSWAHKDQSDSEFNEFVASNASHGGQLLFGRVTYEMMAGYWPTPMASGQNPDMAKHMNSLPKTVFSKSLKKASWNNTQLVKDDVVTAVRKMKLEAGPDMVVLGSGSIVAQLTQAGLVDQFQFVLTPVVVGKGRTLFEGTKNKTKIEMKLTKSRAFKNGNVFLCYEPKK
jgi:dihydrofolate reductase